MPSDKNQNRLVLRYPDGTIAYAFKADDPKCWLEVRPKEGTTFFANGQVNLGGQATNLAESFNAFQLMEIEDELEFFINNLDFIV